MTTLPKNIHLDTLYHVDIENKLLSFKIIKSKSTKLVLVKTMVTFTVCQRSSDPFYVVTYYIKWVTTSWTYSIEQLFSFI